MAISGTQRAFNKMVRHLRKQNRQCIVGMKCMYRGNDGMECAFGCLIPNKLYHKGMELTTSGNVLKNFPRVKRHFDNLYPGTSEDFFRDMQMVHDNCEPTEWENRFIEIADQYNLTIPKK